MMKPYGLDQLPRCQRSYFLAPDLIDMKNYARKPSVGFFCKKSGDFPTMRNPVAKARSRRYIKKLARKAGKEFIRKELASIC